MEGMKAWRSRSMVRGMEASKGGMDGRREG